MNSNQDTVQPDLFQCGQVWKIGEGNLKIGLVGKRLVHYKHYRGTTKMARVPVSLTSKRELGQFLSANKAVLEAA